MINCEKDPSELSLTHAPFLFFYILSTCFISLSVRKKLCITTELSVTQATTEEDRLDVFKSTLNRLTTSHFEEHAAVYDNWKVVHDHFRVPHAGSAWRRQASERPFEWIAGPMCYETWRQTCYASGAASSLTHATRVVTGGYAMQSQRTPHWP